MNTPEPKPNLDEITAFKAKVEHHFTNNDNVRIHYVALGNGPLVVCMHGFPDHWLGWWRIMRDLSRQYRVIAMDLRGYNESDKPSDPDAYRVQHLVTDVQAVIAAEGAQQATVVGHDWGGFVAWHAAMDAPKWVERLIVLNMPHPWAISRELSRNPAQRKASEYVKLFKHPLSHQQIPLERLNAWVRDTDYMPYQQQAMESSSLEAMLNYYRVNWPVEPYAEHRETPPPVMAPTLLVHGLKDPYALPAGLNDVWSWVHADLCIHTIPGAGHFVQHDHSNQVSRVMWNWLSLTDTK